MPIEALAQGDAPQEEHSLEIAHTHCTDHRHEIEASEQCGCFSCGATFASLEVTTWIDGDRTALCPHCSVDAVIGDASGLPATSPEFLTEMQRAWLSVW